MLKHPSKAATGKTAKESRLALKGGGEALPVADSVAKAPAEPVPAIVDEDIAGDDGVDPPSPPQAEALAKKEVPKAPAPPKVAACEAIALAPSASSSS
eukprot:9495136-Pyramimonas_sp.AAC.1